MNNLRHYVYQIIDPKTERFYFGVRSCSCNPQEDSYMGSMVTWKPEDKNRLQKIVLVEFDTREKANECEKKIIKRHIDTPKNENYYIPNVGFKPMIGVNHPLSKPILQYNLNGEFIKEWEVPILYEHETGNSVDKITACAVGSQKTAFGYIWKYKKDIKNTNDIDVFEYFNDNFYVPLKQYNSRTGEFIDEYYSIAQASRKLNIKESGISKCIKKEQKTAGGFIFIKKFDKNGNENQLTNIKAQINKTRPREVLMIDRYTGKILKEYKSLNEAAKNENLHVGAISKCCKSKRNSAGNYGWSYKYDKEGNLITDFNLGKFVGKTTKKRVQCLDIETNEVIAMFESTVEAGKKMGVSRGNISSACNGTYNTAGGYKWRSVCH